MSYEVYGIEDKIFAELEPQVDQYNEVLGQLFEKGNKERLALIKQKGEIKSTIQGLLKQQPCLGVLEEQDVKALGLKKHLIHKRELEELVMSLADSTAPLYFIFKKALLKEQNLCLWVK